jgi:hypothetical protein
LQISSVTPLARSRTNEEALKPFEEEEEGEVTKAAVNEVPELAKTEEAPGEAQIFPKAEEEAQKAETRKVRRRFSLFRAITVKRKSPKVPKVPEIDGPEDSEADAFKTLESGSHIVPEAEPHKERQSEATKAASLEKEAQRKRSQRATAETPKATKALATKVTKPDTTKPRQSTPPKMEKPGLPKVSRQNVSQVSRNAIHKAMEASVPKASKAEVLKTMKVEAPWTPKRESPKPQAVHIEAPKLVKAQAALGSDDNDWCFLA